MMLKELSKRLGMEGFGEYASGTLKDMRDIDYKDHPPRYKFEDSPLYRVLSDGHYNLGFTLGVFTGAFACLLGIVGGAIIWGGN